MKKNEKKYCENCNKEFEYDDYDGYFFCSPLCQIAEYLRKIKGEIEYYVEKKY